MTITDFLEARITEDESAAKDAYYEGQHWWPEEERVTDFHNEDGSDFHMARKRDARHAARWSPARVLAECAAKRAIIQDTQTYVSEYENEEYRTNDTQTAGRVAGRARSWQDDTLRTLATIYADHPDYNPAWRVK